MRELGFGEFVSLLEKGLESGESVSFNAAVRLFWFEDEKDSAGYVPYHDFLEYHGHSRLSRSSHDTNHYNLIMGDASLSFEKREGKIKFMNEERFQKQLTIPIFIKDHEYSLNINAPTNIKY